MNCRVEVLKAAQSQLRIRICYAMIALTLLGCVAMVVSGKLVRGGSRSFLGPGKWRSLSLPLSRSLCWWDFLGASVYPHKTIHSAELGWDPTGLFLLVNQKPRGPLFPCTYLFAPFISLPLHTKFQEQAEGKTTQPPSQPRCEPAIPTLPHPTGAIGWGRPWWLQSYVLHRMVGFSRGCHGPPG